MIIAVDRSIPYWKEAFSEIGKICLFSGRDLKPDDVRDADVLVVRATTAVNASILEGSSVRFVAGASAGIDHIDQDYLEKRGISFGYAAGCNAEAVSEYIFTALHVVASRKKWELKNKSLAVIGVGNVGSRVAKKARALGMKVLLCDPPLREATGDPIYQNLDDVLGADILSFHVPLVFKEPYPTWHMLDRDTLSRLSPQQYLINTSRGAVFDNQELKHALREGRIAGAVLDVWEEEPRIDYSLVKVVDIGTPHIAGSALDGKIRATEMAREELCRFLGIQHPWSTDSLYPGSRLIYPKRETGKQEAVLSALVQAFDIVKFDTDLRALRFLPAGDAALGFDRLRSEHPLRPEFRHFTVALAERDVYLAETFAALGFKWT